MLASAIAYPHPVVGHEGDAAGELECSAPVILFKDGNCSITFDRLDVTNEALARLVTEDRLARVIRVECGATMFRQSWTLKGNAPAAVSLGASKLLGRVDIAVFVVAQERIQNYRPAGLNPDYGDASFTIEAGDVVALGPEFPFAADKGFDPLRGDMSSIMRVRPGEVEGPFSVNFDSDLIEIVLGKSDWERYLKLKQAGSEVLHASLVLPVLTEALGLVRDEAEENGAGSRAELVWFQRLKLTMELRELDDESLVRSAQILLDNPFRRAADAVLRYQDQGDEP